MASQEEVFEYGIECIKKSTRIPDTSSPLRYQIRTAIVGQSGNVADVNSSGQLKVVLDGRVDDGNSSSTPLLAGAEFIGTAEETLDYAIIFVTTFSDVASATNGLCIDISSDGITWRRGDSYTVPAGVEKTYSFQPNKKYYRVHYINGGTNQTVFDLQTILKKTNSKPSSHRIQDSIIDDDDAELVKSIISGKNPAGTYVNFGATTQGNFKVSLEEFENQVSVNDNTQLRTTPFTSGGGELFTTTYPGRVDFPDQYFDIFGKFQVAQPFKLYEYSANAPFDTTRYWSTQVVGSGTVTRNATTRQIELSTTTASGDSAIAQTRMSIQYNKGNAQEIYLVYRPNPVANRRERWGYFDGNNGVFFEHDGTVPRLVIRSNTSGSVVDTTIERANWDDALDGNGPSGLTIDFTKQTVFKLEIGWLSSQGVKFTAFIGNKMINFHNYFISNTLAVPFMGTANLPIRFEVTNTGTTSGTTISSFTCCSVQSSGSAVQEGTIQVLDSLVTPVNVSTTPTIRGYRLNSNYLNSSIEPLNISLLADSGNTKCFYRIIYNPTIVGGVWATAAQGVADTLTSFTSFSGGSVLASGYIALSNLANVNTSITQFKSDIHLGRSIANVADPFVIEFRTDSSTGSIYYSTEYKEYS